MLRLNITSETAPLKAVILGTAISNGPIPGYDEAYDPKSAEHILAGTYPKEEDMVREIEAMAAVLEKYKVEVFRPKIIENYNQIYTRDIAFVIEDKFIKANILPDREEEIQAIHHVISQINPANIITLPAQAHIEGGDVIPYRDYILVGTYRGDDYKDLITARTNVQAVEALQDLFPHRKVVSFDLKKSNTEARDNALHLDCCFQPVGRDKAIIYKEGFLVEEEYNWLVDLFGEKNLFHITREEMYEMNSNIFSISEDVVISEKNFSRLNAWLRSRGLTVEEVPYAEISKQEGLLRCSTLPLIRE